MQNEIPCVFPSQIDNVVNTKFRGAIAQHRELLEHNNNCNQPADNRQSMQCRHKNWLENGAEDEINVFNNETQQHYLEDECWQVIVQEQCSFDEKVWQKMNDVAQEE